MGDQRGPAGTGLATDPPRVRPGISARRHSRRHAGITNALGAGAPPRDARIPARCQAHTRTWPGLRARGNWPRPAASGPSTAARDREQQQDPPNNSQDHLSRPRASTRRGQPGLSRPRSAQPPSRCGPHPAAYRHLDCPHGKSPFPPSGAPPTDDSVAHLRASLGTGNAHGHGMGCSGRSHGRRSTCRVSFSGSHPCPSGRRPPNVRRVALPGTGRRTGPRLRGPRPGCGPGGRGRGEAGTGRCPHGPAAPGPGRDHHDSRHHIA